MEGWGQHKAGRGWATRAPHSLAEDDAVFEAVHEVVPDAAARHALDPLPQLLLPLVVVLLGQLPFIQNVLLWGQGASSCPFSRLDGEPGEGAAPSPGPGPAAPLPTSPAL